MERVRLLVVSDGCAPTGFARVAASILENLGDGFELHQMAVTYYGEDRSEPWHIYAGSEAGDTLGVTRVPALIERLEPDVVLIINDVWYQVQYMQALRPYLEKVAVVMYAPVDARPVPLELLEPLHGVDAFAVYTHYAKRVIESAQAGVRAHRSDFAFPEIQVIAHGVDTERFKPFAGAPDAPVTESNRQRKIAELYGDGPDFADAFIVLNANRNVLRKRIDISMRAFALFSEGKPSNVKLHLHMGEAEDLGWNLLHLARDYGLLERLILTRRGRYQPHVSDEVLNGIYNSAAVGLNTATSEGWGLVGFEHGATGAAQILPRHTALTELWQDAALLVEPALVLSDAGSQRDAFYVAPRDVAEALEAVYHDPSMRLDLAQRAFDNAREPAYRWQSIAAQWARLLRDVVTRRRDASASADSLGASQP